MNNPNPTEEKTSFLGAERVALFVFLFFALIIFVAQSLQYLNSRQIDKKYSDLIASSSYDISTINSLLIHSTNIQRNAVNLLVKEDDNEHAKFKKSVADFIALSEQDFKKMDGSTFASIRNEDMDRITAIKNAYANYRIRLDTFLAFINQNKIDVATTYRLQTLRPSFASFQDLQKDLAVQLTKDLMKESEHLSSYTNKSSLSLLLLGFSPVFFVVLVLIYFGYRLFRMRNY